MTIIALLNDSDSFYTKISDVSYIDFFSDSENATLIFYNCDELTVKKTNIIEIESN